MTRRQTNFDLELLTKVGGRYELMPHSREGVDLREATFSECGRYRYSLTRIWGDGKTLLFVMLNPSTADGLQDDPTIRRCIGYARRSGYTGIAVGNLYALRATNPAMLLAHDEASRRGPENFFSLAGLAKFAQLGNSPVICAWGAFPETLGRTDLAVMDLFKKIGVKTLCFGKTKNGSPRHPLYLSNNVASEPYD